MLATTHPGMQAEAVRIGTQARRGQLVPAGPMVTLVRVRSRSSEHSAVLAPARAAARRISCTGWVSSGPVIP